MQALRGKGYRWLNFVAFMGALLTCAIVSTAADAVAQSNGWLEVAHTQAFGPRYGIQTQIYLKGWANENDWPRNCQSNPFGRPLFLVRIAAPAHADQWLQIYPNSWSQYRPDAYRTGYVCTYWSGFETTIVLPGQFLYPNVWVDVYAWNTRVNNWVYFEGVPGVHQTTYGQSM